MSLSLTTSVTFSAPALLDTVEETANTEHMEVYMHTSIACIMKHYSAKPRRIAIEQSWWLPKYIRDCHRIICSMHAVMKSESSLA